jgi:uncharacterized membrane protein/sporulation protein YlmC with PRC-barrel domain
MLEIPLNAAVECTDGHVGKASHVIFHPQQRTVTHIVVKDDKDALAQDRLVPIEYIGETSNTLIRLTCTRAEMAQMAPFSETRYVDYTYDDYDHYATYAAYSSYGGGMGGPYTIPTATTGYTAVVDEAIPQGQRAVMQGAKVEATDGIVGTVGELLLDPASGQITHFTLQEGHFWGKREVTLPLAAVHFAEEDIVHLKLDKQAIKGLPAVPRDTKAQKKGKAGRFELIARVFDAPKKAAESLAFIKDLQRRQRGALKIHNSAILVKDADGKMTSTETGDLSPKQGTVIGAFAGGLLGALAGPVGILVGAAAGAGLGRVSTRWVDLGLPDDFLNRLQGELKPNSSALILVVEHHYVKQLSESMAGMEGIVLQHTLTDAVVEQLLSEQAGKATR